MDESVQAEKSPMNPIVESGAKKAAENAINRAVNSIVDFVKDRYGETQVLLGTVFRRYLNNATQRYNQVRTLATGPDPRTIIGQNSIYVDIGVLYHNKEISTSTVDSMLRISKNIIILGTGGIGKSMLMRYLFLNTANRGEYVPVLLELRRISNQSTGQISIIDLIYTCMKEFDVQLPKDQFEYSLRLGKYLFLFDGFDEVKETLSAETANAIQAFSAKYPKNPCIITSRPRQEVSPLETFTSVESMPLSKEQAVVLASKIWEEDEKTKEFCHQLEETLYEKHKDFAENPLLLSMMFLTFMRNSSIPDHLADFYRKSYEALYSAHDNNDKGVYHRDFKCKTLDESTFKKLLSHFCFHSYFNEDYEFSELEIISYLEKSVKKHGLLDVTAKDYLQDLQKVVCLIIKDGDIYRFSHRSFQTYFSAYYTANVLTDEQQEKMFFEILSGSNFFWDRRDYYKLLSQIEPERFAINAIEKGLRRIQMEVDSNTNPDIFLLKAETYAIGIRKDDGTDHIIYYIPNKEGEHYICNVISIFRRYVVPIRQPDTDIEVAQKEIKQFKTILKKLSKNSRDPELKPVHFSYEEIDESDSISDDERRWLYSFALRGEVISETRKAVRTWLHDLDRNRELLNSSSFIDEL